MGFNEPDVSFHSNMSPREVADLWPEVEKLAHGKQIVSPITQMKVCRQCPRANYWIYLFR